MGTMFPDKIHVDGETFALTIERKRVKNVNVRLRGSTVFISAPPHLSEKDLKPMVEKLAKGLIRRAHSQRINEEVDALTLAGKVALRFPEPPDVDRVRFVTNQRSRWGSYSGKTRTIRLNAVLRRMPKWVLEAVIAHELAHVEHPNHSQEFWHLLREVCPETDKANAFLAGVSWLGHSWERLPETEREVLIRKREQG